MVVRQSSKVTLSFNQKLVSGSDIQSAIPVQDLSEIDVSKPIPLKSSWALWEQLQQNQSPATPSEEAVAAGAQQTNYGDLTRKVAAVADIQSFWKFFMHLPQPSSILGESLKALRQDSEDAPAHTLAAIMLFREDIRPEWEDEANKKGGHFQFLLQLERTRLSKDTPAGKSEGPTANNWLAQTDEFWNNLVLGLIGGTLEPEDFVTGIRLVDKVKAPIKPGARPVGHLRVEIWFRDASDKAKVRALEESIEAHLKSRMDGSSASEIFPGFRLDMRTHEETGDEKAAPRATRKPTGARKFRKGSADEEETH